MNVQYRECKLRDNDQILILGHDRILISSDKEKISLVFQYSPSNSKCKLEFGRKIS